MQAFIARQPVFDRHEKAYGYELLYRSGWVERYDHPDADVASLKVIADTLNLIGLDSLTDGKPAFFNVTREVLISQACWETMAQEARALGIDEQRSGELYLEALTWAREMCREGLLPA